ncbi:MAG: RimK family alpha-L-glutamate ligase [Phycisphaerae bacterium]
MRIGLITCKNLPEPDPDAAPLAAALRDAGHEPVSVPWDDEKVPLHGFDLFVLRSCWNYYTEPDRFLAWIDQAAAAAPLINTPEVVGWNIHKRYLLTLEQAGVPVVRSRFVHQGEQTSEDPFCDFTDELVIKPAISAGSFGVRRFGTHERDAAREYLQSLAKQRDVMIQPHLSGFRDPGERNLIWIEGEWTHAIRKHPRYAGDDERVEGGVPPTREELKVADAALAQVPYKLRYARADLVPDEEGRIRLSELELLEPSLFFDYSSAALQRFVQMIENAA